MAEPELSKETLLEDFAHVIVNWPLYRKYEFKGDFRLQKAH